MYNGQINHCRSLYISVKSVKSRKLILGNGIFARFSLPLEIFVKFTTDILK